MEVIGELGSVSRSRVRFQESDSDSLDSNGSEIVSSDGRGFELVEDSSFWKDHNVQVVIRIRPLNDSEISLQGYNKCIRQDSAQSITWIGHPESRFTFDIVADEHVSQEKLFKVAGVPMVENCVAGYNSCMFAYGQTGSGKTHTMLGDIENGTRRHSVNCGMTPRVFEYLFSRIQKEKEARRDEKLLFICKCSFLEIYNEQILDLLNPSSTNLQIREDAKKGVHVENLKEFEVSSARDVLHQLIQGAANRKVAATNMNRASSRSHSVFTCVIESKWEAQGVNHHRFARLNLVDLAGSERQKSSGAEGDRLKEATNINKSLSTLGLVIMNLVSSSNKKPMHVPYRDSKLTFLLQDSLGGNSKTTIIANISPSNCCALETLSTLKFAQRAKFIRNNAVINEDASGDVLAMRMQIQQLKKEVSRLQGLLSGGHENSSENQHDSPGTFKWDGVLGSFSPLTFDKRLSQRKEYEAALVAAFRRDRDKSEAIKALTAAREAAEQLATQRSEEVKGLKMRIKFREEGIKRLQAVNSGKLSAETHLLQEKEELLKEIEVLRNQVDRNPEVTRFAMENLQLREDLRRLQAFVDEGERDMLNEQITVLQDKLLEALDWKLMHEKDAESVQDRLNLNWDSAANEENEFLRMQAIQNQREVESLRNNLALCLEAKEKLERHVDQLSSQIKQQRPFFSDTFNGDLNKSQSESSDDQTELKTMVNAIAVASQREAEAHEAAIILTKENEELREKIKVLIEDNNKLIELYDSKNDSEQLQHKLNDMHEENEKLLGLYEKAMQEKGELIKLISTYDVQLNEAEEAAKQSKGKLEELSELYEKALLERDEYKSSLFYEMNKIKEKETMLCERQHIQKEEKERLVNKLDMVKHQLETTGKAMEYFGLLERATFEVDELWDTIKSQNESVKLKQQELSSLKSVFPKALENKTIAENKFLALKAAAQKIYTQYQCCNEREQEAVAKVESLSKPLAEKREELKHLKIKKEEVDNACANSRLFETELRNDLARLKTKYQNAEAQRKECETVLFAIDNNKPDILRPTSLGKASEMLKSEEERVNISVEIKKQREKIGLVLKEISDSKKISESLGSMIRSLESWIESGMHSFEEAEIILKEVVSEKQALNKMIENEIISELPKIMVEYQECLFNSDLKEEEIKLCDQEVELEVMNLEGLREKQMHAAQKLNGLLEDREHMTVSKKIELELGEVQKSIDEAKSLLVAKDR